MARQGILIVAAFLFVVVTINVADGGKCTRIPHCDACDFDQTTKRATCTKCDRLFGRTTNENGFSRCSNCSDNEGCLFCDDFTVCQYCRYRARDGPDFNGRATCSPCAPNCRSCAKAGSGKCDMCAIGARKVGDLCQQCDLDNCASCDSSASVCDFCKRGFFFKDGKCVACVENCKKCNSVDRCLDCFDNFFLEQQTGMCLACIDNCQTCVDYGECSECKMGFYRDNKLQCSPCDDSCLTCKDKNTCVNCKQGRSVGGSCKCAPNCKTCRNSGYGNCDSCIDGFVQDKNKKCVPRDSAGIP